MSGERWHDEHLHICLYNTARCCWSASAKKHHKRLERHKRDNEKRHYRVKKESGQSFEWERELRYYHNSKSEANQSKSGCSASQVNVSGSIIVNTANNKKSVNKPLTCVSRMVWKAFYWTVSHIKMSYKDTFFCKNNAKLDFELKTIAELQGLCRSDTVVC